MKKTNYISKALTSVFLLLFMMSPLVIQFVHSFENHKHTTCKDQKNQNTHIHQKSLDCHICDFHFFSFTYDISSYPEFVKATITLKVAKKFTTQFINSFNNNNTLLRGPPNFLA
jgi:ABC-type sugar transport system permease subunit